MLAKLKSAVKSRKESLVRQILQEDKPRLDCQEGAEMLWHAVLDDEVEIASMLVRAGTDLSIRRPGCALKRSFLHVLANSLDPRHHRLAVLMMDHGADVNAQDGHATGVLHRVIVAQHSGIGLVRELLHRGCRVRDDDVAIGARHPLATELLPLLIESGNADDDTRKERLSTALLSLSYYDGNESEILPALRMLLDTRISVETNMVNLALLYNAIRTNKINMVQLLIDHGFEVTTRWRRGDTPLHVACMTHFSFDMIRLLMLNGATFNCFGSTDRTPFSLLRYSINSLSDEHQFAIKQLFISAVKGFPIKKVDLNQIVNSVEMKTFYERCRKELKLMTSTSFFNDITFFSILSNRLKYLSFLTRNDKFVQSYRDSLRKSDFPIFYDELEYVFNAAEERKNVLLEKEEALCEELNKIVPYVPLEKIIYHFYVNEN